jgi:hypothetical protein
MDWVEQFPYDKNEFTKQTGIEWSSLKEGLSPEILAQVQAWYPHCSQGHLLLRGLNTRWSYKMKIQKDPLCDFPGCQSNTMDLKDCYSCFTCQTDLCFPCWKICAKQPRFSLPFRKEQPPAGLTSPISLDTFKVTLPHDLYSAVLVSSLSLKNPYLKQWHFAIYRRQWIQCSLIWCLQAIFTFSLVPQEPLNSTPNRNVFLLLVFYILQTKEFMAWAEFLNWCSQLQNQPPHSIWSVYELDNILTPIRFFIWTLLTCLGTRIILNCSVFPEACIKLFLLVVITNLPNLFYPILTPKYLQDGITASEVHVAIKPRDDFGLFCAIYFCHFGGCVDVVLFVLTLFGLFTASF